MVSTGGKKGRKAAKGPSPKRRQRPVGTAQSAAGALLVLPYLEHIVAAALAPGCTRDDVSKYGIVLTFSPAYHCISLLSKLSQPASCSCLQLPVPLQVPVPAWYFSLPTLPHGLQVLWGSCGLCVLL